MQRNDQGGQIKPASGRTGRCPQQGFDRCLQQALQLGAALLRLLQDVGDLLDDLAHLLANLVFFRKTFILADGIDQRRHVAMPAIEILCGHAVEHPLEPAMACLP